MHNPLPSLTVEQQFSIVSFEAQVNGMSREQAIDMLKSLYKAHVTQKAYYLELLKHKWFPVEDLSEPDKR